MIKHCKNCGMPDTRPGIYFNEEGVCQGCLYEDRKNTINWDKRWEELERFVRKEIINSPGMYDCVIAVSGGKDSHFQTHLFKEKLGLNCLLVCVTDNCKSSQAGIHNLKNIAKEFDCDLIVYKMGRETQKKIMRYTFEKYNKPFWIIDQLIYTVPIWMAIKFAIPIVVYGENVSVTRGLKDNKDIPIAWNQINNSVVSDIRLEEVAKACGLKMKDLIMVQPQRGVEHITTPIYTSYYIRWDAHENYLSAIRYGFKDLGCFDDWNDRWGGFMNFWQIDSFGYLMAFYSKWANLGHSGFTDCVCELIRSGYITKKEGEFEIEKWEGTFDQCAMDDFCDLLDYTEAQVLNINQKFILKRLNHD